MTPPNAVLVVGPAWVGDMVLAQSLFMTLRQRYPQTAIDVVAPGWTAPLLERMPEVRHALPLTVGHGQLGLLSRWRLGRQLRETAYDQAIILPRSYKSALIPFWAKAKQRTGYLGELRWGLLNDVRPLDKQGLPRTVDRFVALALDPGAPLPTPFPIPALRPSPLGGGQALAKLGLEPPTTPLLALCPGAEYGPAKQWPLDYFATVAKAMHAQGWTVWVFGSSKDSPASEEIIRKAGCGHNLAGRTTLAEAIDLLAMADHVVSNDSGLMHVAAALGRPVIALFGSSDPRHTPPMGNRSEIVSHPMPCSPCFKRTCPVGDTHCLVKITPEQVLTLLGEQPP